MNKHQNVKTVSNKNFGVFFSIVFLLLSLYFLFYNNINLGIFFSVLCFFFFIISFISPNFLGPLNKLWFLLGIFLGKIISPIVLGIIYFCIFTPISIFFKLISRDELNLKFHKGINSYWIKKDSKNNSTQSFKNQY